MSWYLEQNQLTQETAITETMLICHTVISKHLDVPQSLGMVVERLLHLFEH